METTTSTKYYNMLTLPSLQRSLSDPACGGKWLNLELQMLRKEEKAKQVEKQKG